MRNRGKFWIEIANAHGPSARLHFRAAPMFHMANITPEAMGDDTVSEMLLSCGERRVEVTKRQLCDSYETLDSGKGDGDDVSLVALGNPHLR